MLRPKQQSHAHNASVPLWNESSTFARRPSRYRVREESGHRGGVIQIGVMQ
jgi:hypothetical protein